MSRKKTIKEQRKREFEEKVFAFKNATTHFVPVKIMEKKWAKKLLDGEVYMRPLLEFGELGNTRENNALNNNYRGDPFEGICSATTDISKSKTVQSLDPAIQNQLSGIIHVDTGSLPYFKLFCLYCLEYDFFGDFFKKPDPRVAQFGDTAVVIWNFNSFLMRLHNAFIERYKDMFVSMCRRVHYLDLNRLDEIVPIFEKRTDYQYQNELRIAINELGNQVGDLFETKSKSDSLVFEIGSIRDIAYEMPIDDFLNLRGIKYSYRHWPNTEEMKKPTVYDNYVKRTNELIENNTKKTVDAGVDQERVERYALVRIERSMV